jgi:hypothetical protein
MHTIAQKYYEAIKQGVIGKGEIVFCPLQLRLQRGPRCVGRLDTAAATSCVALVGGNVSVPRRQKYPSVENASVHLQPEPQFARENIDGANLLRHGIRNVGHRHG